MHAVQYFRGLRHSRDMHYIQSHSHIRDFLKKNKSFGTKTSHSEKCKQYKGRLLRSFTVVMV